MIMMRMTGTIPGPALTQGTRVCKKLAIVTLNETLETGALLLGKQCAFLVVCLSVRSFARSFVCLFCRYTDDARPQQHGRDDRLRVRELVAVSRPRQLLTYRT